MGGVWVGRNWVVCGWKGFVGGGEGWYDVVVGLGDVNVIESVYGDEWSL